MTGRVTITAENHGRTIRIQRDELISDEFWLVARSHWGSGGNLPGQRIDMPVESFLDRLGWLAPACRAHGVSLDWDAAAEILVRRHRDERRGLTTFLADPPAVRDVVSELGDEGSRWSGWRELRGFQERDLGRLLAMPHGANFSVPGAGKTAVTLALYELERRRGRVSQMLVVAPLSAFEAWQEEVAICLDPAPVLHPFDGGPIPEDAEIVLVNYQRMLLSFEPLAEWLVRADTQLCLDEAHRIKRGRAGEWGSVALDAAYLAARRDILTGTPAPQGPRDLAVLLDFLWWGQGHRVLPAAALTSQPPLDVADEVADAIRPLYVRTTKEDLKLPGIKLHVQPIPLEGLHKQVYDALRAQYAGRLPMARHERASWARKGQVVMYLLEGATNPGLLAAGSSDGDPREFLHPPLVVPGGSSLGQLVGEFGAYETPRKFIELASIVQDNQAVGRKTLVWSNFVRNLQVLERTFAALEPAMVHGGIHSVISHPDAERTREAELHRFRTDPACWVLLANPAAMAEGVSLHTACRDAVYLDRTFNAGQYLQSLDRIHRLGLDKEVRVTFLVAEGTIDEAVNQRVEVKAKSLFKMLEDPSMLLMVLPDEDDVGDPLDPTDAADVAALFAHLRGDG